MHTSRSSRLWQTWLTTRISSCASYVSMHELATSNTMKHCSRKLTRIQARRRFHLTSMKWRRLHWLTVISTCHASLGYAILPWLPCSIDETCVGLRRYVQNAIFSSEYKYKQSYTVLTVLYPCLYLYILCSHLKYGCSIGGQSRFKRLCSSWHPSAKTQQNRFYSRSCAPIDSARWGCPTQVVGVLLPYSTPYPAVATYKVGWVDRGEHAGGVGVSR